MPQVQKDKPLFEKQERTITENQSRTMEEQRQLWSEVDCIESVFSCIKRMFGREYVTAIRFENMIKEMILKASLYNLFQSLTIT